MGDEVEDVEADRDWSPAEATEFPGGRRADGRGERQWCSAVH